MDCTAVIEDEWRRWARASGYDTVEVLKIAHGVPTEEVIRAIAPQRSIEDELRRFAEVTTNVDQSQVKAVTGTLEFVASLEVAHWAVVTSADREPALERLLLAGFPKPRVLVSADEVQKGKPDPEGFLSAALQLAAKPADCLVFEDSAAAIMAANRAGIRVIAVKTLHTPLGSGELLPIETFAELRTDRRGDQLLRSVEADGSLDVAEGVVDLFVGFLHFALERPANQVFRSDTHG